MLSPLANRTSKACLNFIAAVGLSMVNTPKGGPMSLRPLFAAPKRGAAPQAEGAFENLKAARPLRQSQTFGPRRGSRMPGGLMPLFRSISWGKFLQLSFDRVDFLLIFHHLP